MTDSSAKRAYDHWKQADAAARDAEIRLATAWEGYFARKSRAPGEELIREVSQLRAIANDRLTSAMVSMSSSPARETTLPGIAPRTPREDGPGAPVVGRGPREPQP